MANSQGLTEPERLKGFARFFKNYMSVSAIVTAALPIPITSFGMIPTYRAQTHIFSVYTSLFCFLLLGFIFYSRHLLARLMFPEFSNVRYKLLLQRLVGILPAMLIGISMVSVYFYHIYLNVSLNDILGDRQVAGGSSVNSEAVLRLLEIQQIPCQGRLMILYLSIFLCAESAFILMAIKEYLQDLLGLSELELIEGRRKAAS